MAYPEDRSGTVAFGAHRTWYRVDGPEPATSRRPPLVVLHGGPGAAHDYCLAMTALATPERAVVLYDQLGCGRSTHLPDADPASWSPDLFVAELRNLLDVLGIAGAHHVLGQSWGGMLALEYALRQPAGLRGLVLADTLASMPQWRRGTRRLVEQLDPEHVRAIDDADARGDHEGAACRAATAEFYRRHVCRVDPMPAEVVATFAQIDADPTVYHAMNGPSEFTVTGSLREWSVEDRLGEVTAPTLVLAGAYDESTPDTWGPLAERIPGAHHHMFPRSSHMPHVEESDAFRAVVGGFLDGVDAAG